MQAKGSCFYHVSSGPSRKWTRLGSDLATAKRKWAELEDVKPASLSVADLVADYIDRPNGRAASTQQQYRSYQRAIAEGFPIPAAELTSQHVALWQELQGERQVYADGCVALLKAAFRRGKRLGLSDTIEAQMWRPSGAHRDRVLEPGEFRAIRARATDWLQVLMDLAYLIAMRPCDLRSLRWSQINADCIATRHRKTGQRVEFSMTPDLTSVLATARQRPILGLYVVGNARGRKIGQDMMSRAWRAACAAAGVTDAQFRDIRAMAAKAAKEGGQDFQTLLGHTTRAMSERYIKGRQTIKAEPVRRKL
jgi:integrase